MRARCLIPFVAIALAGCTGLRAESGTGAEAGSCVAHLGPVPAPVASTFDPRASLEEVRIDYPQAKLDEGPAGGEGVLTFGPAREGLPPDPLSFRFLQRHVTALGVGETPTVGAPLDLESPTRTFFAYPLRDTGCARIRVTLERGPSGPTSLRRTCERLRKAPPSYAARPLPQTAMGDAEILVRIGVVGGFAGPLFSGYVIDRFGDVYRAADSIPRDAEPYMREYVATLPPADVERFACDVSSVRDERPRTDSAPAVPDLGALVVQAYVGQKSVPLDSLSSSTAERARRWAEGAVGPH